MVLGCVLAAAVACGSVVYPEAGVAKGSDERALSFDNAGVYGKGFVRKGAEIECDNGTDANAMRGAQWRVDLNQKVAVPFSVTAESRAFNVSGRPSCNYSVYLDVAFQDGTKLYGQHAAFVPDPSLGWQKKTVAVSPEKPVKFFACYLMHRGGSGKVRFRAPKVSQFFGSRFCEYDSCFIDMANRRDFKEPGFAIRDVTASRGYVSIVDGGQAEGIALRVKRIPMGGGAVLFDVSAKELTGKDRAVSLVYAVPVGGKGPLVWHEDPRTSKEVPDSVRNGQCRSTVWHDAGEGELTRWPFGAVTAGGRGEALGIDCSAPAFFRATAHGPLRQIFIAFDLGFTKEKPDARFRFVHFGFPAEHGFRGALAEYQKLFPEMFKVRIKDHGLWMAFWKISTVQGWEDFGFRIKECDNEPDWDDAHGILTFHYTEPSTWWMKMPKDTAEYDFADCFLEADRLAANGDTEALAWRRSAFRDETGRVVGSVQDTPWCKGAVWNLCALPDIPGGDYANNFSPESWSRRYDGNVFPKGVDGEYIDSAEGYLTAQMNFNREHFAYSRTPLVYSRIAKRPGIAKPLMMYEYVRETADRCHAMGRYLMGNGMPVRWPWLVAYSDYGGQEIDWRDRKTGKWKPSLDKDMLYRRAMNGAKPYCFLMNTDFDKFPYEFVEKYMQRSLAYGFFASFFSPNAALGHYFSRPELYNRDRPLFKKYVPLCKIISEAGWRPVNTLLASDNPEVFVEQFGDRHVTVFNTSDKEQMVKLTSLKGGGRAKELVAGGEWRFDGGSAAARIPPETVRLLAFE